MTRRALLPASALLVLSFAAAPATAQAPPDWVRAAGLGTNTLRPTKPVIFNFGAVCSTPECNAATAPFDGSLTMKVDAATQRKYKLPSRTIATSTPFVVRGEARVADMKASALMRAKLKKVKSLPITTTFVIRAPLAQTATKKSTFFVGSGGTKRFCIGTSADPLCGPTR